MFNGFIRMRVVCIQLMVLAGMLGTPGCSIDVTPGLPVPNDNGEPGDTEDKIVVSFTNLAEEEAVDVEFYLTEATLEIFPDDLFVDENRVRGDRLIEDQGIGMANLATISPGEVEVLTLSCDRDLTLGTTGGTFVDAETGEERGQGTMIGLRQQDGLFSCGTVIEFAYEPDGEGFTTTLSLNP